MSRTLGEIAHAVAGSPGFAMPPGFEPGLEATHYFSPSQSAYCNGTHIAEVEVDIETGHVGLLKFTCLSYVTPGRFTDPHDFPL